MRTPRTRRRATAARHVARGRRERGRVRRGAAAPGLRHRARRTVAVRDHIQLDASGRHGADVRDGANGCERAVRRARGMRVRMRVRAGVADDDARDAGRARAVVGRRVDRDVATVARGVGERRGGRVESGELCVPVGGDIVRSEGAGTDRRVRRDESSVFVDRGARDIHVEMLENRRGRRGRGGKGRIDDEDSGIDATFDGQASEESVSVGVFRNAVLSRGVGRRRISASD